MTSLVCRACGTHPSVCRCPASVQRNTPLVPFVEYQAYRAGVEERYQSALAARRGGA